MRIHKYENYIEKSMVKKEYDDFNKGMDFEA